MTLTWTRPSAWTKTFQLHSNHRLEGTLSFHGIMQKAAESPLGQWEFEPTHLLGTTVTIRKANSQQELARFKKSPWGAGGILLLPNHRCLRVTANLWRTIWDIRGASGESFIRIRTKGLWKHSADVSIHPGARTLPELPWLQLFAWYVATVIRSDEFLPFAAIAVVLS